MQRCLFRLASFPSWLGLCVILFGCVCRGQDAWPTRTGLGSVDRHIEALGTQAGIWGTLSQRLEAWVYPFKAFEGLEFGVIDAQGEFRSIHETVRLQSATPDRAILEFAEEHWELSVSFFCPRHYPGGVIEIDGAFPLAAELAIRLSPVVTPMHLEVDPDRIVRWDSNRGTLTGESVRYGGRLEIRSPAGFTAEIGDDGQVVLRLTADEANHRALFFSLVDTTSPPASEPLDEFIASVDEHRAFSRKYYEDLIRRLPVVESPNVAVNDALLWAGISLDQLRVRNPDLGWGLVSGYSSSQGTTRPKYTWFFEEPTLTSWAYHRLGLSEHVQTAFDFLRPYHRQDGKTVHEVTQGLAHWPKFFDEFRYAYMHSDGPVYYLVAYGHYLRSTGRLGFIREHWEVIEKAFRWCQSRVDVADGLITVDHGDWGSAESSTSILKDTQLEAMWLRALREVAYLARSLGKSSLANEAEQLREQAKRSIEAEFWNESNGFYIWGIDRAGRKVDSLVPHHAVGFWLSDLRDDRTTRALRTLAGAEFMTDWGVRSLALSDPRFDHSSYQSGSVWPVWHAGVAIADYHHGQSVRGFQNWRTMIEARWGSGLGPMPEVFRGDRFELLPGAVPHQMFSEIAVVNGFYDGLLGLEVDVPGRRLTLAPSFPMQWETLSVQRVPFGDDSLDLVIDRQKDVLRVEVNYRGDEPIHVGFRPELPGHSIIRSVKDSFGSPYFKILRTAAAKRVEFERVLHRGRYSLEIRQDGGFEFVVETEPLDYGQTSRRLKVLNYRLRGGWFEIDVQGRPGREYVIRTRGRPLWVTNQVEGGVLERDTDGNPLIKTVAPKGEEINASGYAEWSIRVQLGERPDRTRLVISEADSDATSGTQLPARWGRVEEIKTRMQEVMGRLPGSERLISPDLEVKEEVDMGSYVRRLVTYQTEPNSRIPAYLLIPKDCLAGRRETYGILCLHPTDDRVGHQVVVGLGGRPGRNYAEELAERGFVTLAPAYPLLANYQPELEQLGYASGTMKAIWDNQRSIDLLESFPFVHKGRVGAIGHSLGGHNAIYSAVFDPRIKVIVSSCGFDSYLDYMNGEIKGWTSGRYMPRLLDYALEEIPFDFHEMLAALAPRALWVSAPLGDTNFQWKSVDRVADAAREVYGIFGARDQLQIRHPDCGHDFPLRMRTEAYDFIEAQLESTTIGDQ